MTTTEAVVRSVERLHELLAEWIGTAAPPAVLDEFLAAQAADFAMVTTEGQVLGLAELRVALAGAGGADPGLKIAISDVEIVGEFGDAVLVRFREHHVSTRGNSARQVSAVLVADGSELRWRHLHETPIAG